VDINAGIDDYVLLRYDGASFRNRFHAFRRNIVSSKRQETITQWRNGILNYSAVKTSEHYNYLRLPANNVLVDTERGLFWELLSVQALIVHGSYEVWRVSVQTAVSARTSVLRGRFFAWVLTF